MGIENTTRIAPVNTVAWSLQMMSSLSSLCLFVCFSRFLLPLFLLLFVLPFSSSVVLLRVSCREADDRSLVPHRACVPLQLPLLVLLLHPQDRFRHSHAEAGCRPGRIRQDFRVYGSISGAWEGKSTKAGIFRAVHNVISTCFIAANLLSTVFVHFSCHAFVLFFFLCSLLP